MPASLVAVAIAAICAALFFSFRLFFIFFLFLHLSCSDSRLSYLSYSFHHRIEVRVAVGQARALPLSSASVLKVGTRFVTQKPFALVSIFFLYSSAPLCRQQHVHHQIVYMWLVPALCMLLHPLLRSVLSMATQRGACSNNHLLSIVIWYFRFS